MIKLRDYSFEAARDWYYELNGNLTPDISYGSNEKAYFKCPINPKHIYNRTIKFIINKSGKYVGCPYCNGTKAIPNITDFFTVCSEAKNFWDYDRNPPNLDPTLLLPKSGIRAHFKCKNDHPFTRRICDFTSNPKCSYCSGSLAFPGETDFFTVCQNAKDFWDYDKNSDTLNPIKLLSTSYFKAHFRCQQGHPFTREIKEFTLYPTCPYCNGSRAIPGKTDFFTVCPEAKVLWDYEKNSSDLNPTELLPYSKVLGHFKCSKGHPFSRYINNFTKNQKCPCCNGSKAIPGETDFFTICSEAKNFWDFDKNQFDLNPTKLLPHSGITAHFICMNGHSFSRKIHRFTKNPTCPTCSGFHVIPGETDFFTICPEAKEFWDFHKNLPDLNPVNLSPHSSTKAHFKCNLGHRFTKTINDFSLNPSCSFCNRTKAIPGETDFFTICPEAKNFWDFDKNQFDLNPTKLLPHSGITADFICMNGHSFSRQIYMFTKNPTCPTCSGFYVIPGETDFFTICPEAKEFWDFNKNLPELNPVKLLPYSTKKAHFICKEGHQFKRRIQKFTKNPSCPTCNGFRAVPGETDFFTVYPEAKEFWDFDINQSKLDPTKLLATSANNAHFRCKLGHSYRRRIRDYTKNSTCPFCNGSRAITGQTDFFTVCPEAKEFWDYKENPSNLKPTKLLATSTINAKFICEIGHKFSKYIIHFTNSPKCSICNYVIIEPGINSLKAEYNQLVESEWNYLSNSILGDPDMISPLLSQNFFWICKKCDNSYISTVNRRVRSYNRGLVICPFCNDKRVKYTNY